MAQVAEPVSVTSTGTVGVADTRRRADARFVAKVLELQSMLEAARENSRELGSLIGETLYSGLERAKRIQEHALRQAQENAAEAAEAAGAVEAVEVAEAAVVAEVAETGARPVQRWYLSSQPRLRRGQ